MLSRRAVTLLELVVSLASSIVLVAGLAGSVYIANQALDGCARARQSLTASTVLRDMMVDVSEAKTITKRTDHAITFTVPDRDSDGAPETIRYEWLPDEPLKPLTYQYNGGALLNIATDVRAFNLSALTRELEVGPAPQIQVEGVKFHAPPSENGGANGSVTIPIPDGTTNGDLLIACVVKGNSSNVNAPSGWYQVRSGSGKTNSILPPRITFGVWYKKIVGSETGSYHFTWISGPGYGWIMRFTGHDPDNPIYDSEVKDGPSTSPTPECLPVTSVDNAMILRLGGFDGKYIGPSSPGMQGHTLITLGGAAPPYSGGAGWSDTGDSGFANFVLSPGAAYVTVTIAIAPKPVD